MGNRDERKTKGFAIDSTVVYSETFHAFTICSLENERCDFDYFVMKERRRPDVDPKNPDIKFHLHIDRELVTISLDSSGDLLLGVVTERRTGEQLMKLFGFGNVAIGWLGRKRKFP